MSLATNDDLLRRQGAMAAMDNSACNVVTTYKRALGAKVWMVDGVPWRQVGASTVMAFPAATVHPINQAHLTAVFQATGHVLAQFATAATTGWPCTVYTLRDQSYSEKSLQRQFRQRLQRGNQQLTFRRFTWSELGTKGVDVVAAPATQDRKKAGFDHEVWLEACELAARDPRFIVFGCLQATTLVGFAIFLRHAGWHQAIDMICHPGSFGSGSANFLLYHCARELIREPGCHAVSFGRSGIPHAEGPSRFMRHAGLGEEPIQVAAALHPRWSWLGKSRTAAHVIERLGRTSRIPGGLTSYLRGLEVACKTDVRLLPLERRSIRLPGHRSAGP